MHPVASVPFVLILVRAVFVLALAFAGAVRLQEREGAVAPTLAERIELLLHEHALDPRYPSGFGFSALVELDGAVVWHGALGCADEAGERRTTERTLFNIASMTKSFTAVAVMQLEEQKKLSLDDPITKFFEAVPEDKRAITLAHLLTHSSGLEQTYASDGIAGRDDAVRAILAQPLAFRPGESFAYASENFELLAAVIEHATGRRYEEYVRERELEPARARDTKFWVEVGKDDPSAAWKRIDPERAEGKRDWGMLGSGGLYSTTSDLHAWFEAVRDSKLTSRATLERMWTPRVHLQARDVASGWFVSTTRGTREIWTRGNESFGHNAVLRWFPDKKLLVIVLTNSGESGGPGTTANRTISDALVELLLS